MAACCRRRFQARRRDLRAMWRRRLRVCLSRRADCCCWERAWRLRGGCGGGGDKHAGEDARTTKRRRDACNTIRCRRRPCGQPLAVGGVVQPDFTPCEGRTDVKRKLNQVVTEPGRFRARNV